MTIYEENLQINEMKMAEINDFCINESRLYTMITTTIKANSNKNSTKTVSESKIESYSLKSLILMKIKFI